MPPKLYNDRDGMLYVLRRLGIAMRNYLPAPEHERGGNFSMLLRQLHYVETDQAPRDGDI